MKKKLIENVLFVSLLFVFSGFIMAQTATPTPIKGTTVVTQKINSGAFTVTAPANVTLPAIMSTADTQTVTGIASTWRVEDARGKKSTQQPGWTLNLTGTDFSDGATPPSTISKSNLTVTPSNLVTESGVVTGVTLGTGGSLSGTINVITASTGNGKGKYKGDLGLSFLVPANPDAVDYTSTLTFSLQ